MPQVVDQLMTSVAALGESIRLLVVELASSKLLVISRFCSSRWRSSLRNVRRSPATPIILSTDSLRVSEKQYKARNRVTCPLMCPSRGHEALLSDGETKGGILEQDNFTPISLRVLLAEIQRHERDSDNNQRIATECCQHCGRERRSELTQCKPKTLARMLGHLRS
jgi:hypothetical protein